MRSASLRLARGIGELSLPMVCAILLLKCSDRAQSATWVPIRPELSIVSSNNDVTLSWLLLPIDLSLQTTSDPDGSSIWTNVSLPQSAFEDRVSVTLQRTNAQQFFRLEDPFATVLEHRLPIFWFSIFYGLDGEINPGAATVVDGPVHCNSNLYVAPITSLTFQQRVTAAGAIFPNRAPGDPTTGSTGTVAYAGGRRSGVEPLNLSIGPGVARQIVEPRPVGEDPLSDLGKERFYNKADLILLIKDSGVTATSGLVNNFASVIPSNQISLFLTNVSFYNARENKIINATQIDIGKLRQWNATNDILRPVIPATDIRILYVADLRTQMLTTESGVRLVNGQTILPKGLTVATPNPLYVMGHYNCPVAAHLGTTNTSAALPASLIADAVTILSPAWNDGNSAATLPSRVAVNMTVNAAILAGIVPTMPGSYSGGIDNFPRLLEDWASKTFTFNGSMTVMFHSVYANGQWGTFGVYNPPIRRRSYDSNLKDLTKLPPGTPMVGVLATGQ